MTTPITCSVCGAPKSQLHTGQCTNRAGCERRRVERRIREDQRRGGPQCMASKGTRSIRFCTMRKDHDGKHAQGGMEWGNEEETAVGRLFSSVLQAGVRTGDAR